MRMVTLLRQDSYSLKLDQNSRLNGISTTLSELTSTTKKLNKELFENQPGLVGPSRAEMSSAEHRGKFQQNQSSLLTLDRVDTLSKGISRLVLMEQELGDVAREQAVLRSLNFPSRPVRHDNICPAHEETFRWMVNPPEESKGDAGQRFLDWLRVGDGIFWVSGKPGSGKSTLMKFLADHKTTRAILEEWANQAKLVIAAHYFWSAGTPMQKSHEGLFLTLLYEIFRTCPALIAQVCHDRWVQTNPVRPEKNTDWTISELLGTLQILSRYSDLPVRYCFFIDGIDEFDGDHFKLCEVLRDLSQSPNIKLCLASRPWNVFVDAFGIDPVRRIYIEDLTRNDILQYTESRLMEHQRWNRCHFGAKDRQSIIDGITEKAQGVFLWVFLVTKSLRDGLTNGDTMLELRNRLESLPTDLERFFKHMLEVVDLIYHEKMASFLSIAVNAKQPLHFLIYSMHEHEYEDEGYAAKTPISPLSEGEIEILHDVCRRRVNARCGGLLNVKGDSVEFLHRTVRDFLFTHEMSDFLGMKTRPGFSANLSTFRAYVSRLKRSTKLEETVSRDSMRQSLLEETLQYARDALEDSEDLVTELLDNLEDLYLASSEYDGNLLGWKLVGESDSDYLHGDTNFYNNSLDFQFRKELLRAGIDKYVCRKLCDSPHYFDDLNEPPLSVVINQPKWTTRHIQVIHDLLKLGQDPNARHNTELSTSPWTCFILRTCWEEHEADFHSAIENGLFSLFLHCGASKDACIDGPLEAEALDKDTNYAPLRTVGTPCSYFIKALFSHSPKYPDKSLRILDDFFDLSLDTRLRPTVLGTLWEEVKKIEPKTTKLGKLRFFAKIAKKIVNAGVSLGWEMSFLSPDIERAFPSILRSTIVGLVKTGGYSEDPGRDSLKREAENDLLEYVAKRTK
jgi:hypothetical protein